MAAVASAMVKIPIYKLSVAALKAMFGDETVDMHISRKYLVYKGEHYDLPIDMLRERTLKVLREKSIKIKS